MCAFSGTSVSAMRQFDTGMQNMWSANKYLSLKLKWNFWLYIFSWKACEEHSTRWSHPQPGRQNTLRHFNSKQKNILEFSDEPLLLFILQSQKLHHLLVEDQVVGDQWSGRQGLIYGELAITLWIILHPSSYPACCLDKKCNHRLDLLLSPNFQKTFSSRHLFFTSSSTTFSKQNTF